MLTAVIRRALPFAQARRALLAVPIVLATIAGTATTAVAQTTVATVNVSTITETLTNVPSGTVSGTGDTLCTTAVDQVVVCNDNDTGIPGQGAVAPPYYPASLLPNAGDVTPAESTALEDLEAEAVANTISDHQLAATDGPAVLSWGRDDAEAELWALLVQAIQDCASTTTTCSTDQQGAVDWLDGLEQAQDVEAAQDAGFEYARWAGLGDTAYEQMLLADPSESTIQGFLSGAPEPTSTDPGDPGEGYCNYQAPAPYTWQNGSQSGLDPTCFGPCPQLDELITGCAPVTPSYNQFLQWGQADLAAVDNSTLSSSAFVQQAGDIAIEAFGGAVGGTAQVLSITPPLAAALSGTPLEASMWPAVSDIALDAAGDETPSFFAALAATLAQWTASITAGEGAAVAAEGTTLAGSLSAATFTGPAAIVILAVTTAALEGVSVANNANLPGQLAQNIATQESATPDLSSMLLDPAEGFGLYSLFAAATMVPCSAEDLTGASVSCVGSDRVPLGNSTDQFVTVPPLQAPPVVVCPAGTDLSQPASLSDVQTSEAAGTYPCDAPPLPATSDRDFLVQSDNGVIGNPSTEGSISFMDGTTTDSAWMNGNWFVETQVPQGATSGPTSQALAIQYTDWSGVQQDAWVEDVPSAGGLLFFGYPTPTSVSSTPIDPSTCLSTGACWASPFIDYVGADGNDYYAEVAETTPAAAPVPAAELTATATTTTASPAEGSEQSFEGVGTSPNGPVSYSWSFEQPPSPGSTTPFWSAPVTGTDVGHTWPTSGTWGVEMTASDPAGNSVVDDFDVTVADVAPQLSLSASCTGQAPSSQAPVCPSGAVSIAGTLVHAGAADTETLRIDWGDGTVDTVTTEGGAGPAGYSGPVSLSYATPDIGFTDSHTYAGPGAYQVTVTATDQSGAATSAATSAYQQASQSISFPGIANHYYGADAVPIQAQGGSSGQPVVLTSATPSVCSVTNPDYNTPAGAPASTSAAVGLLGAGTCTITANQYGTYVQSGSEFCPTPTSCIIGQSLVSVYQQADQVEQSFTVEPAVLTVTPDDETMAYGGTVPNFGFTYQGFVNGDTSSAVSTPPTCGPVDANGDPLDAATLSAGTYGISCSGATAANYAFNYDHDGTLNVQPVTLTVTADDETMTYGGAVPSLSASYSGLVNGDTPSSFSTSNPVNSPARCTTAADSQSPAGTYKISCLGVVDPNYNPINYVPGTLTVQPAPLTATADDETMAYGGTVPNFGVTYQGFVNGDRSSAVSTPPTCGPVDANGGPLDPATAAPGTYTITCSGASAANYAISYAPGLLTVNQADSSTTLTASPGSPTFGQVVTLSAEVAPASSSSTGTTPTGTVTFSLDGQALGAPVTLDGGQAQSLPIANLAPGPHQVSVSYSGDPNYLSSAGSSSLTVTCSQTITASTNGSVSVTGSTCVEGATLSGPVKVSPGGTLALIGARVSGPISANGAASVLLCGSTVSGPVTLTAPSGAVGLGGPAGSACTPDQFNGPLSVTGSTAAVDLASSTVSGPVTLQGDTAGVTVTGSTTSGPLSATDDGGGVTITGDNIGGPLTVSSNTGTVTVSSNTVSGPVTVSNNTSPSAPTISANTVYGPLACSQNSPAPTDAGQANSAAGPAQGQCAQLA